MVTQNNNVKKVYQISTIPTVDAIIGIHGLRPRFSKPFSVFETIHRSLANVTNNIMQLTSMSSLFSRDTTAEIVPDSPTPPPAHPNKFH